MTSTDAPATSSPRAAALPEVIAVPSTLFVPLPKTSTEHVPIGTRVTRGQALLINVAGAAFVPLAPADATVSAIRTVQLLDGKSATALELTVEAHSQLTSSPSPSSPPTDLLDMIERLRRAGVWANRHTSPNLLGQLHEILRRPIDTLVCNMLDVDGGSALHARLLRESGAAIVSGVTALAKATAAGRIWIATTPRLADRVGVFVRKAAAGGSIKVVPLANDYPQADPTLLLYALLGRRLKPDHVPPEVGALVIDGAAALAVARVVESGEAMLTVPIEVRDSIRSRSHVASATVGTPLHHVLKSLDLADEYTLRAGAALRDVRISPDAIVSGAELSIDAGSLALAINPDPCIRCGWCVEACPVRIHPAGLLEAAQNSDMQLADHYGIDACIECGICSYVCPSRLPLLGAIRTMRKLFDK